MVFLKLTCLDIEDRYEIDFLKIGSDKDHIHFLHQSVPSCSPKKIARTIKVLQQERYSIKLLGLKVRFWVEPFREVDIMCIPSVDIVMKR